MTGLVTLNGSVDNRAFEDLQLLLSHWLFWLIWFWVKSIFVSCFYHAQKKQAMMNHLTVFLIYLHHHSGYSWLVVLVDLSAIWCLCSLFQRVKPYGWEVVFYSETKQLENTPNCEAASSPGQGIETAALCPAPHSGLYQTSAVFQV